MSHSDLGRDDDTPRRDFEREIYRQADAEDQEPPEPWTRHAHHSPRFPVKDCHLCWQFSESEARDLLFLIDRKMLDFESSEILDNAEEYLKNRSAYERAHPEFAEYGCYEDQCHYWWLRKNHPRDCNPAWDHAMNRERKCGSCAECQAEHREMRQKAERAHRQAMERQTGQNDEGRF